MTAGGGRPGRERIGPWQLALLLVTIEVAKGSTVINHWLAWRVGRDQWISALLALPCVLGGALLLIALAGRPPGELLSHRLKRLLGVGAYPVGLLYVGLFLADAAVTTHTFGSLARLQGIMALTPAWAFEAPLVALGVYAGWLGIEVTARVNAAVLVLVELPAAVVLALLTVNHESLARVLPVLVHGLRPVLWGGWLLVGGFGELVLLLVYLPLVGHGPADQARARRAVLWAVAMVAAAAIGPGMGPVLAFGDSVGRVTWPIYTLIRSIQAARFISNLDWILVVLWIHAFWVDVAVFTDAAARTLAPLLGLPKHRVLILPLGVLVFLVGMRIAPNNRVMLVERWWLDAWGFLVLGYAVPLLLLALAAAQDRLRRPWRPRLRGGGSRLS